MTVLLPITVLWLTPISLASGLLLIKRRARGDHSKKSPISRKVCRYPGYTLCRQIEDLNDQISLDLGLLIALPAMITAYAALGLFGEIGLTLFVVTVLAYGGLIGFLVVRLLRTEGSLSRKRAGLAGEQIVGHHLTSLSSQDFRVFHDVPLEFGNIDHVAVSQQGVFAIETKYRRKLKKTRSGHELSCGEDHIEINQKRTTEPIDQAKRQANTLATELSDLLGETSVTPVLVYPGWFVKRESSGKTIKVVNDVQLSQVFQSPKRVLDENSIDQISKFLESRCNDVTV